uniref:Uncharacterized protein n=1 Tax=Oncorhynchus kisutch TaxID=8019 RepID=A0A8C7KBT6_ONCKI
MENPHCKLETLRSITDEGCVSLDTALRSNPSHLRELDLSYNHLGDTGVRLLSAGLEDPHLRLEKLKYVEGLYKSTLINYTFVLSYALCRCVHMCVTQNISISTVWKMVESAGSNLDLKNVSVDCNED